MVLLIYLIGLIMLGFKVFQDGINVTTTCVFITCALALYLLIGIITSLLWCLVVM